MLNGQSGGGIKSQCRQEKELLGVQIENMKKTKIHTLDKSVAKFVIATL